MAEAALVATFVTYAKTRAYTAATCQGRKTRHMHEQAEFT
jgi:hypothetical protein